MILIGQNSDLIVILLQNLFIFIKTYCFLKGFYLIINYSECVILCVFLLVVIGTTSTDRINQNEENK